MQRVLNVVAIVGGLWTLITGAWGLFEVLTGATPSPELADTQGWIAGALVTAGIALIALGAAGLGARRSL